MDRAVVPTGPDQNLGVEQDLIFEDGPMSHEDISLPAPFPTKDKTPTVATSEADQCSAIQTPKIEYNTGGQPTPTPLNDPTAEPPSPTPVEDLDPG